MTEETTSDAPVAQYVVRAGVATITFDRPQARNALNAAMVAQVDAALSAAEQAPDVAVIVLTGSDPAFCAGLDIREFGETGRPPAGVNDLIQRMPVLTKPTIGAINGPVLTGGLEFALGLDILIASERAVFGDTHAKVGILPGGGMTAHLPRAVGQRLALEMSFTGRLLTPAEALQKGLVTHVLPHDELLGKAQELGEAVAARNGAIVRELKRLYRASLDSTMGEGLANEIAERDARRARGNQLVPSSDRVPLS
ncbi:enoyl-CoA hydratase [Gordonia polyisoprenivorans]|uniref:enoyl-CoA hydratase n=1 Tax=Gordonia polyisoprenivorans TaxID=84595 RepID=UPI001AD6B394|nr:enoyl-CoA hydratase [Gordonia polyisoprenivorans]QTI70967.1 enoyl-CoA hydratase [Gordonia polyisoprenivorans]